MAKKSQGINTSVTPAELQRQRLLTSVEIIRRRRKAKLTRAELAEKIGATEEHVTALEKGDAEPMIGELARIADAVRCSVADLLPPLTRKGRAFAKDFVMAPELVQDGLANVLRGAVHALQKRKSDGR